MKEKYYLATGRFSAFDKDGNLLNDEVFLNKIFEGSSRREIRNKAIAYIKNRISQKYGKDAMRKQMGSIGINPSKNPPPNLRNKSKVSPNQLRLPMPGL